MATDFSTNAVGTSGGIKPTSKNTPGDIRTRIETIDDVKSIPLPFVGMIFYVIDENKFYKVVSLKDKITGPLVTTDALVGDYEELIPEMPKFEFNANGELVVTINGVTKTFVAKEDQSEEPETPVEPEKPDVPVEPEPEEDHTGDLIIAQYYGTGGKTDGMLTCDFIELYNAGDHIVSLEEVNLVYTAMNSRTKNNWMLIELPDVDIPAHHSFLIQGQMNREAVEGSDIPVVVPTADFIWGGEIENSGVKLVISKATEAYPAGHVDPFEIDETIIDCAFTSASDKTHYFDGDVELMMTNTSKHKAAYQEAPGRWVCADYKDSLGQPKNLDKLPRNLAFGPQLDRLKEAGPQAPKEQILCFIEDLEALTEDYYRVDLTDMVDDFEISEVEVDGDTLELVIDGKEVAKFEGNQLLILTSVLMERLGSEFDVEVKSEKYSKIVVNFCIA